MIKTLIALDNTRHMMIFEELLTRRMGDCKNGMLIMSEFSVRDSGIDYEMISSPDAKKIINHIMKAPYMRYLEEDSILLLCEKKDCLFISVTTVDDQGFLHDTPIVGIHFSDKRPHQGAMRNNIIDTYKEAMKDFEGRGGLSFNMGIPDVVILGAIARYYSLEDNVALYLKSLLEKQISMYNTLDEHHYIRMVLNDDLQYVIECMLVDNTLSKVMVGNTNRLIKPITTENKHVQ